MVIEDVGTKGNSGIDVHADIDWKASEVRDALWVHTMSSHECDIVGRPVQVRVLAGSETHRLGVSVFDGELNIASGVLAVGHRRSRDRQLLFGTPSIVRLSVFLGYDIEAIRFGGSDGEYPVSGASEVNVLIHGQSDFAPASSPLTRRSGVWLPRWRRG